MLLCELKLRFLKSHVITGFIGQQLNANQKIKFYFKYLKKHKICSGNSEPSHTYKTLEMKVTQNKSNTTIKYQPVPLLHGVVLDTSKSKSSSSTAFDELLLPLLA